MPTLTKRRGKERWRAVVWMDGRIAASKWFGEGRKGGEEYRKAIVWEEQTKKNLLAEMAVSPEPTETPTGFLTVYDWASAYLSDAKRRCGEKTYKEKRSGLRELMRFTGVDPAMPMEDLSLMLARRYLEAQHDSRSGYAANKDRKNLAAAWKWGRLNLEGFPEQGANPFRSVVRFPEQRNPRYVPPEKEFWKVYQVTEGQDRIILTAFLHLAARRSEVFRLTWNDVDFENGVVILETKKTKSSSIKRSPVPMTSELKAEFAKWRDIREHKDSPHVFTVMDGAGQTNQWKGQPYKTRRHWMETLCKRAGVRHFGLHAIRHLSATILYKSGYPVRVIQQILRHETAATTERYLKSLGLDPEVKEAVSVFEGRALAGNDGRVVPITAANPELKLAQKKRFIRSERTSPHGYP